MRSALAFPKRISVELTNHCNQRCLLCPRQEFTRPLGFMDEGVFDRITDECAAHDTMLWLHFLGEPLLHRHAIAFIELAKSRGCRVGLSTNAVSLQTYAERLLDSGLDRLECSLDAADRENYETMRGRDHFERASENVRDFLHRKQSRQAPGPVTSIQFMRTPQLTAILSEVVESWRPLLGPSDFIMTIEPISFGGAIPVALQVGEDGNDRARPPCAWLFESLMILQDGTVTMCGTDWDATAPLGSVCENSIGEIWRGAEIKRRRAAHRAGRFDTLAPCATCTDWPWADGHGYSNVLEEIANGGR